MNKDEAETSSNQNQIKMIRLMVLLRSIRQIPVINLATRRLKFRSFFRHSDR